MIGETKAKYALKNVTIIRIIIQYIYIYECLFIYERE